MKAEVTAVATERLGETGPLLDMAAEVMAAEGAVATPVWTGKPLAEAAETMAAVSAAGMAQLLVVAAEAMAAGVGQQPPAVAEVPPRVVFVAIRPLAVVEATTAAVQRGLAVAEAEAAVVLWGLAAEALRLEGVVEAVQQQAGAADMVSTEAMQPEAGAAEPAAAGAL